MRVRHIYGNEYLRSLMQAPSVPNDGRCAVCGQTPVTVHHIVPRGQGGLDGPTVALDGHGTAGCHGRAEDKRLHFKHDGERWYYLNTANPTKYETALQSCEWKRL
jgi:hypothetical protein